MALARDERDAVVQVFFIREGKLIGRDHFHLSAGAAESEEEILDGFVKQFYAGTPFIPRGLWLQYPLDRQRGYQPVADHKTGTEGKAGGAPEGGEGKAGGTGGKKCGSGTVSG